MVLWAGVVFMTHILYHSKGSIHPSVLRMGPFCLIGFIFNQL